MRLIVVSAESFFEREPLILNKLFELGLETLHLRKPFATENETRNFLLRINGEFHNRIVLHDYFLLSNSFAVKGIHLNRRNSEPLQQKGLSLSRSCHSLNELENIDNFNYVFLSPIFDSISKTAYKQAFTPEELNSGKAKGTINEKVIALGGILPENISLAAQYGFGGVAVSGVLWKNFRNSESELYKQLNNLLSITKQL